VIGHKPVATGISHGRPDKKGHVERAVRQALEKTGTDRANAVLLFLTSDYAHDPLAAIRSAARAASCTQVIGATGLGLLTEDEWVIDSSGAAAMVFTGQVHLGLNQQAGPGQLRLCLSTPQAVSSSWLGEPVRRFGAITSDEFGQGPYAIWHSGTLVKDGFMEVVITGASAEVVVARGVQALTAPMEVDKVAGFDVHRIAGYPALHVLISALPNDVRKREQLPLHTLMCGVTFGEPETAIDEGRFRLDHIVSANTEDHSVTLSHPLQPGQRLFWALRDSATAEQAMRDAANNCSRALGSVPDFAIMFPCLSRGPLFFGGTDKDVSLTRETFPYTPLIGFYGNGEIAPIDDYSHLHQYSTVLAAFRCHNA
jgi:small ligand-binding sensory domain FIST